MSHKYDPEDTIKERIMVMNKKEKEHVEKLSMELSRARAFRFTDPVLPDVLPPKIYGLLLHGFTYNEYTSSILFACSSSGSHAVSSDSPCEKTNSQQPIVMYSTRSLALKGLRNALEKKYSESLAKIDREIQRCK